MVRKLAFLKVYTDVVEDGLGSGPFLPDQDILLPRGQSDFLPEDIGFLVGKVDIPLWVKRVHKRFSFLKNPTIEEIRWAQCNPRDLHEVRNEIVEFGN
jgi:hypothetical protein